MLSSAHGRRLHQFRRARVRDDRDHQRHRAAWRIRAVLRHVPDLHGIRAQRGAAGVADGVCATSSSTRTIRWRSAKTARRTSRSNSWRTCARRRTCRHGDRAIRSKRRLRGARRLRAATVRPRSCSRVRRRRRSRAPKLHSMRSRAAATCWSKKRRTAGDRHRDRLRSCACRRGGEAARRRGHRGARRIDAEHRHLPRPGRMRIANPCCPARFARALPWKPRIRAIGIASWGSTARSSASIASVCRRRVREAMEALGMTVDHVVAAVRGCIGGGKG